MVAVRPLTGTYLFAFQDMQNNKACCKAMQTNRGVDHKSLRISASELDRTGPNPQCINPLRINGLCSSSLTLFRGFGQDRGRKARRQMRLCACDLMRSSRGGF
jgi:hypothetical protein